MWGVGGGFISFTIGAFGMNELHLFFHAVFCEFRRWSTFSI